MLTAFGKKSHNAKILNRVRISLDFASSSRLRNINLKLNFHQCRISDRYEHARDPLFQKTTKSFQDWFVAYLGVKMVGVFVLSPFDGIVAVFHHEAFYPMTSLRISPALRDHGSDQGRGPNVDL